MTDEPERLQARLARLAAISLVFLGVMNALGTLGTAFAPQAWLLIGHRVAVLGALALVWRYLRGPRRTRARLSQLDAAFTVLLPAANAPMMLVVDVDDPHLVPEVWNASFATFVFLVARSAIVPSSALRTAALHGLAVVPNAVVVHLIYARYPQIAAFNPSEANVHAWLIVFVAASAGISHTISGLRRRIGDGVQVGAYRLGRMLGHGGMGTVYEATHTLLGRKAAIKLLLPEKAGEGSIARFEREARITTRLVHANIVAVYDYGRTADGVFYYAMELVDGTDLERLVAREGPLAPARAVAILRQVCAALGEAHAAGLVHRDIKPSNILVCGERVKVVDFGLVKQVGAADELTRDGQLTGTPLYLAPECITSAVVDARTDLYALGAVGYFLVTGEAPFGGGSVVEVCSRHLYSPPESPSRRRGQPIGEALDALLLACLAKDPEARPATAAALDAALARAS
jgi:eukaryotic-like serine/threonine-protein kinase